MECIKVETLQEVESAKRMIASSDYEGARAKLLELWHHFPALDDIVEMITVCDILCSAEFGSLGCDIDWYWVLQVTQTASESDIYFRYRKFSTLLEPIKSDFPGAAYALEIIHEAFSVLSNPEKRSVFDSKRAARLEAYRYVHWPEAHDVDLWQRSNQKTNISPSFIAHENSIHRIKDVGCSKQIHSRRIIDPNAGVFLSEREVKHEEISTQTRVTRGIHVINEQRKKIWVAAQEASTMISPVSSDFSSQKLSWSVNSMDDKGHEDEDFYDFDDIRMAEVFACGQIWAAYDEEGMPRSYAWINSIDKSPFRLHISWLKPAPVTALESRWCEAGLPVACGFFDLDKTRAATVTAEPTMLSHMVSQFAIPTNKEVEIYPKKHEIWAIYKDWKPLEWSSDPEVRRGTVLQMVEILTGYSNHADTIVAGLEKVEVFKSVFRRCTKNVGDQPFPIPARDLFMFSHSVPAHRFVGGERERISEGMFLLDPLAVPDVLDCVMAKSVHPKGESVEHKWSTKDFAIDQLWAVYDDGHDFMPRRYAIVNNVVSLSEVCVTFLEPHPMLDDEIYWVKENLPFVCGSFRVGRTTLNLGMSRFSHLVKCERIADKFLYKIYPKKGEIWAMYRNWNSRWKQSEFSHYQCQIVEIVADFSDESGLIVASLVEVPGCATFFQRQLCNGFELIRAVTRTDMLSFSHQIPAFTIWGSEIHGIPEGSWHLESVALPPNFFS